MLDTFDIEEFGQRTAEAATNPRSVVTSAPDNQQQRTEIHNAYPRRSSRPRKPIQRIQVDPAKNAYY
ncbi:unnamed protein product [Gongylonema pulchrum]|uniref:Uncharacterized protein n=1 Tax=Gongylonema pulchrum TaxID=637853 RepID=A0A183EKM7_9BILA|nr:unnamed protein product [Gongylonema pulchrum]